MSNAANGTVISISSDDSLIFVGTCNVEKVAKVANYSADCSDSTDLDSDSSWSFETPPDLDDKLKLLYSGRGSKFLYDEPVVTSTPKQKLKKTDNIENESNNK